MESASYACLPCRCPPLCDFAEGSAKLGNICVTRFPQLGIRPAAREVITFASSSRAENLKRSVACCLSSLGGLHFCEPRILFSRRSRRHSSGRCSAEKIGGWIHALRFIRSCIRLIVSCDRRCCNRLGRGGSGFNVSFL